LDEEEAVHVRELYRRYAAGASLGQLCRYLMDAHVRTAAGNQVWRNKTVRQLLMNTVYKGQAAYGKRVQRHAPEDFGKKYII
jgi:hypothetical protein